MEINSNGCVLGGLKKFAEFFLGEALQDIS